MRRPNTDLLTPIAQLVALALYVAMGYLYVVSGLGVPTPFVFLLWASWGALLVIGFRHRHDMRYLLGVPVSAAVLWATIALGLGSILDWQA